MKQSFSFASVSVGDMSVAAWHLKTSAWHFMRFSRGCHLLVSFRVTIPLHCLIKHLRQIHSNQILRCLNQKNLIRKWVYYSIWHATPFPTDTGGWVWLSYVEVLDSCCSDSWCFFHFPFSFHTYSWQRRLPQMQWPWQRFLFQKQTLLMNHRIAHAA